MTATGTAMAPAMAPAMTPSDPPPLLASGWHCTYTPGTGGGEQPVDNEGGGGSTSFWVPPMHGENVELLSPFEPRCPAPSGAHDTHKAWCEGAPPTSEQLARINEALIRIKAHGGVCTMLAEKAEELLHVNAIRIFPDLWDEHSRKYNFAGAAPLGGNWAIFASYMVDDSRFNHPQANYEYSLDWAIAHEMDHVRADVDASTDPSGHVIVNGNTDRWQTKNSNACSRLITQ